MRRGAFKTAALLSLLLCAAVVQAAGPASARRGLAAASVGPAVPLAPAEVDAPQFPLTVGERLNAHLLFVERVLASPKAGPDSIALYLESQRDALPLSAEDAAAHLAALNIVSHALAAPASSNTLLPKVPQDTDLAELNLKPRLTGLSREVGRKLKARGQRSQWKALAKTAADIKEETEAAAHLGALFDGALNAKAAALSVVAKEAGAGPLVFPQLALSHRQPSAKAVERLPERVGAFVRELQKETADSRARIGDKLKKGLRLQSWGVPSTWTVENSDDSRKERLYTMDGLPTRLGQSVYEMLAPLVAEDKRFLGTISALAFEKAVEKALDSLAYVYDPDNVDDMTSLEGLGLRLQFDAGFKDEFWYQAHLRAGRAILKDPDNNRGKSAGFAALRKNQWPKRIPSFVLSRLLGWAYAGLAHAAPSDGQARQQGFDLISALHAVMRLPMPLGPGHAASVTLSHRQLLPLLTALRGMRAPEQVLEAVVKAFPLGESLWQMGLHKLWQRGLDGSGVVVGVIDDGVDFGHPDLDDLEPSRHNFTREDGELERGPHSTAVTSIIHALAPKARINSYKVFSTFSSQGKRLTGEETEEAILRALDQARADGVHVINMSLGGEFGSSNDRLSKKVDEIVASGIIVVVAAGNSGSELRRVYQMSSPGTAAGALTVGAMDYEHGRAAFSSAGPAYDTATGDILERPDIYSFGRNVWMADRGSRLYYQFDPLPYARMDGTSFSTPHISGVAALLIQALQNERGSNDFRLLGKKLATAARKAMRAVAEWRNDDKPLLLDTDKAVAEFLKQLR